MNIGKVIRALRQEEGATLEAMALEIGSDAGVERGVQEPTAQLLEVIVSDLKVSVSDLYAFA